MPSFSFSKQASKIMFCEQDLKVETERKKSHLIIPKINPRPSRCTREQALKQQQIGIIYPSHVHTDTQNSETCRRVLHISEPSQSQTLPKIRSKPFSLNQSSSDFVNDRADVMTALVSRRHQGRA
jgi:hypothetical protein